MKILILKPSSLGDVIQALPVLRLLRRAHPRASIHWWLFSELAPILEGDPDLDGLFLFDRRKWKSPRYWPSLVKSALDMRAQSFDLVIDLQGLARSGLFSWIANGSTLVGLDDAREGSTAFYDLTIPRRAFNTHAVDYYLQVLRFLKIPVDWNFTWLPERPAVAAELENKWSPGSGQWIAINPGARWHNKRWPVESYADLVRRLGGEFPAARFAILGSRSEQPLGAAIAAANPERCLDLTGQTTLPEMVEWIRKCSLMVTNDTGPMHIAAAMNTPVVALFGPTEPTRTGPYRQNDHVLRTPIPCAPCMKSTCAHSLPMECLRSLSVGLVVAKAKSRLAPCPPSAPALCE